LEIIKEARTARVLLAGRTFGLSSKVN
jgi:hypothetical protein